MADQLVEMDVESVRVHMPSSQHVVILKERDRERYLPIWIGPWEANAIAMRLQGLTPERPMTHDLVTAMMAALGVSIRRVVISSLADETFHARLFLVAGGREVEVDSRPSDALALAVRSGAPIFAADAVLEQAGVHPEAAGDEIESLDPDERATPDDPRLSAFRDFINSLDVESGGEHREGPTREK